MFLNYWLPYCITEQTKIHFLCPPPRRARSHPHSIWISNLILLYSRGTRGKNRADKNVFSTPIIVRLCGWWQWRVGQELIVFTCSPPTHNSIYLYTFVHRFKEGIIPRCVLISIFDWSFGSMSSNDRHMLTSVCIFVQSDEKSYNLVYIITYSILFTRT